MTEELTVVDAAAQLTFVVHGVITEAAAELGLSVTQLRVLGILRDRTPTMASLAEQLGLDRSSVSGLVDRAEKRGLVVRQQSAADRRVVTVGLTGEGQAVADELEALVNPRIEAVLVRATAADRRALQRVAGALPRPVDSAPDR